MFENYPSKLLEEAVNRFSKLPGIGKKGALRMVLHLLKEDVNTVRDFSLAITKLREHITYCKNCHNISDTELCNICSNPKRDYSIVCVVEDLRDVMAIENTSQYNGLYHVLGGIISPMEGIGPNQLNITSLVDKANSGEIAEVVMALSTTMEGDTTIFYISKKINSSHVKISTLARGVAIGGDLEFADELTLGRSIANRVPYEFSTSAQIR
ncbi:MAG TPA: recombination mediator RecR [Bacteroidia bacterium]|nr:recombination mediator RecR [Bacteroidia bacterium]HNU34252.1 recombination mediator RecR [Bacteroidia bacterium]